MPRNDDLEPGFNVFSPEELIKEGIESAMKNPREYLTFAICDISLRFIKKLGLMEEFREELKEIPLGYSLHLEILLKGIEHADKRMEEMNNG